MQRHDDGIRRAPAVATSGKNSVAGLVLMSQIFRLRVPLNKAKGKQFHFSYAVAMQRPAHQTRRRILIVCHCDSGS